MAKAQVFFGSLIFDYDEVLYTGLCRCGMLPHLAIPGCAGVAGAHQRHIRLCPCFLMPLLIEHAIPNPVLPGLGLEKKGFAQ